MTARADDVLAAAASQLGYYRTPGTRTKFGEWYGLPTGQWCAMFISWCAAQAGATDIIPKHAYTPSGAQWFKDRGQWYTDVRKIKRGDILYFDFPGAPNRISHVAIAETDWLGSYVQTIEGNTSGTVGGDQRNGGLCGRKHRAAYIVGFGRPKYATTKKVAARWGTTIAAIATALGLAVGSLTGVNPGTTPDSTVTPGQVIEVPDDAVVEPSDPVVVVPPAIAPGPSTPVVESPAASSGVKANQAKLNLLGYGLVVDGLNGPKTKAATRDVQRRCGITRDGVYGPVTDRCVTALIASKVSASAVVRLGDVGAKVTALQRKLVAAGYKVTVDGRAGAQTIGAVYAAQVRCGIARDRIAGPATIACLDRLAGAKAFTLARVLQTGSRGADVVALQKRLGVKPDGVFGSVTKSALVRYQRGHNLTPDGKAGPQVARSLGWGYR